MKYSILIDPENSESMTLDSDVIRSVDYVVSPCDNEYFNGLVRNISLDVEGVVSSRETQTLNLLRWLQLVASCPFCCSFELTVMNDEGELVRKIKFPDAKINNYKEIFDANGAKFSFHAVQDEGSNNNIVVE